MIVRPLHSSINNVSLYRAVFTSAVIMIRLRKRSPENYSGVGSTSSDLIWSCKFFLIWFKIFGLFPHPIAKQLPIEKTSNVCVDLKRSVSSKSLKIVCNYCWYIWSGLLLSILAFETFSHGLIFGFSLSRTDSMTEILLKGFVFQWTLVAFLISSCLVLKSRAFLKIIQSFWRNHAEALLGNWTCLCNQSTLKILFISGFFLGVAVSLLWCWTCLPMVLKAFLSGLQYILDLVPFSEVVKNCTNLTLTENFTICNNNQYLLDTRQQLCIEDASSFAFNGSEIDTFALCLLLGYFSSFLTFPTIGTAMVGSQIFFVLLSVPITACFRKLTFQLKEAGSEEKSVTCSFVKKLSKQHLDMTRVVTKLDEIFGPVLLLLLASDFFVIVTILGVMRKGESVSIGLRDCKGGYGLSYFAGSVTIAMILLILRTVAAVSVAEEAALFSRKFVILVESELLDTMSAEERGRTLFIVSRMQQYSASFTAYGMFSINRALIASIVGVLLTYMTLLWEMDKK